MAEEPILAEPQSVEPSNYDLNPFPSDPSNNSWRVVGGV